MEIELLTVSDVASVLKVSKSMVYTLVSKKEIESVRIGIGRGTIRIAQAAIEKFISRKLSQAERSTAIELPGDYQFISTNNTT